MCGLPPLRLSLDGRGRPEGAGEGGGADLSEGVIHTALKRIAHRVPPHSAAEAADFLPVVR